MVLSPYCVTIRHIPAAVFIPKCFTSAVRLSDTQWYKLLWGQLLGLAALGKIHTAYGNSKMAGPTHLVRAVGPSPRDTRAY